MLSNAYLAGLFDGEGWVSLSFHTHKTGNSYIHFRVGIAMTHNVVSRIGKQFGKSHVYTTERSQAGRLIYRLGFQNRQDVTTFLSAIYPFLVVKKRHAKVILAWCKLVVNKGRSGRSEFDLCKTEQAARILAKLNIRNPKNRKPKFLKNSYKKELLK